MELVGANDLLKKAGINLAGATCVELDPEEIAPEEHATITDQRSDGSNEEDAPGKGAPDEFETGMYMCGWPNGEFSVVMAATTRDALTNLDEWAPEYPSLLFPMDSCMVDFGLNDDGGTELNQLGEDTKTLFGRLPIRPLTRLGTASAQYGLMGGTRRKAKNSFGRLLCMSARA